MTHRENFLKKHGLPADTSLSIGEISKLTDIPVNALREIFNRGIGAWKSSIESVRLKKDFSKNPDTSKYPRSARLGKEMWAMARIYSFIQKGKTFKTADKDIATKYGLI
jgi:hypothetical protein